MTYMTKYFKNAKKKHFKSSKRGHGTNIKTIQILLFDATTNILERQSTSNKCHTTNFLRM